MEHSHRLPVQESKQTPICAAHSKKSGVAVDDLVKIFCALPEYLDNVIESVQRKALPITLPDLSYAEALHRTSLQSPPERTGAEACCKPAHGHQST